MEPMWHRTGSKRGKRKLPGGATRGPRKANELQILYEDRASSFLYLWDAYAPHYGHEPLRTTRIHATPTLVFPLQMRLRTHHTVWNPYGTELGASVGSAIPSVVHTWVPQDA